MKLQVYYLLAAFLWLACNRDSAKSDNDSGETPTEQSNASESDADGDGDSDSDNDGDSDTDNDTDGDSDGDADGEGDMDVDADGDSDADGDTDGDTDGHGDGDADTDGDADADSDEDVDTDADSDTESGEEPPSETSDETDEETDTGTSEPETDTSSETETVVYGPDEPECERHDECKVVDDCCSCMAIPVGKDPPLCTMPECFAPSCTVHGVDNLDALCVAGRCTLLLSCDANAVTCKMMPPECPDGTVPAVLDSCWTGSCLQPECCSRVTDCDDCLKGQACVVTMGFSNAGPHCTTMPEACHGKETCDCMSASVCIDRYGLCLDSEDPDDTDNEIDCVAP